MTTLLQRLLIETLSQEEEESVLGEFINTILPPLEQEFSLAPALGGLEPTFANKADQSLLVHILNGLFIAWNLSKELFEPLSDIEQRLLCLGFTLHDYDKYFRHKGEASIGAHQTEEILKRCQLLGEELLDFYAFWEDWQEYHLDICFLAQNTQRKNGSLRIDSAWENHKQSFQLEYSDRDRLCDILAFADVAIHMHEATDLITKTGGDRLRELLGDLGLDLECKLTYHHLRDCRGLIANRIHNTVVNFTKTYNWKPLLYFAQGTIYLAPVNSKVPSLEEIQENVWESILNGDKNSNLRGLQEQFSSGDVGFIRGGKGLKFAPLTRELFTSAEIIVLLSDVIISTVKNIKNPATQKRLDKISFSSQEREFLERGADVWSDRLAEFIIIVQRNFFAASEDYANWVLDTLELQAEFSVEQTQIQKGGVNYGWYQVAAHYIAKTSLDRHPGSEELTRFLQDLGQKLVKWATDNNLLPTYQSPTYQDLYSYLAQYLDLSGWEKSQNLFDRELAAYTEAKSKNKPICSLSSGEFTSEDQLDSVVLFKPQQYSNKNALGGRRIKRGISTIWSLEMMMRQAYWAAPAGKLEDQKPIFLYIFPAYVYSPQIAKAIARLMKMLQKVSLWEVRKQWLQEGMDYRKLQHLLLDERDPKPGRYGMQYSDKDLPFMAMTYTTTQGKTYTDAWVEPAFLTFILPVLLGVKVVATPSSDPLYVSDKEFLESVRFDGMAEFWNLLGLKTDLRLQELEPALECLLAIYALHLEAEGSPPDARWQALNNTVREAITDVLNVFALAQKKFRADKREPSEEEVKRYWKIAEILTLEKQQMKDKLKATKQLVREYRTFYQVRTDESSHSILLPLSKALETILSVPEDWDDEELIFQGAGQLHSALERQEVYKRPLIKDKSIPYTTRQARELEAIQTFMTTCVKRLFGEMCKRDRALLQEHRNRIKSGAEFAYRLLSLEEKSTPTNVPSA